MARDPDRKKPRRDKDDDDRDAKPGNVEEELQELEGAWDEAEDKGDLFGEIPDDKYQSKITGARIGKSKSSNRIQIAWEFTILSGEYKNRKKFSYDGLETKENLDYVKTRLARLKVKIPKISDLAEALESCIGLTCEIQVKTRGDFQNVYVNKLIDVDSDTVQDADDWKPSKRSRDDDDRDDDKPKKSRDDDDDDRPKRSRDDDEDKPRSRRDDDDDDDKPKKGRDRDDDDDAPRKSRRDDDDDKPRKSRDDDDDDRPRKSKF